MARFCIPLAFLIAFFPLAWATKSQLEPLTAKVDALDYYAYWKLFDALTDAAFYGRNRDYALGGGRNQTHMGRWSDGKPVEPLQVRNDPGCKAR
jgi:hypothetical protein